MPRVLSRLNGIYLFKLRTIAEGKIYSLLGSQVLPLHINCKRVAFSIESIPSISALDSGSQIFVIVSLITLLLREFKPLLLAWVFVGMLNRSFQERFLRMAFPILDYYRAHPGSLDVLVRPSCGYHSFSPTVLYEEPSVGL